MNDPIADMLTRIRNAVRARHARVDIPYSGLKLAMANILKTERYITDAAVIEMGKFKAIRASLRYDKEGRGFITGLTRISRPGCRVYRGHQEIPRIMGGLGMTIVSTPRGLMSGQDARKNGVGGEVLCSIW